MRRSSSDNYLLRSFAQLYPQPRSELNFRNQFELIVAVILSAQCTDKKVNQITPSLFSRYPTYPALASARLSELEEIVRPINYYRTKAKSLIGMAAQVVANHNSQLPISRTDLEKLPGVGRKTASVILCELGIEPALPVDTHVFRVARRLGLATAHGRDEVEEQLRARFPPKRWHDLHHWLIFHGRRVCKAQRPRCGECAVNRHCPSAELVAKPRAKGPSSERRSPTVREQKASLRS